MNTFSPRFRSQSAAHNGGPGGALSYGDMSVLQGLAGNDPRNTLLLNANNSYVDDALTQLLQGGTPSPVNRAWMESHYLTGEDLQSILNTRQGIRGGTAQAYFSPDGQLNVRRQGEAGWNSAAPNGSIGIGADGGGYNPISSARIPGLAPVTGTRYTADVVRDPVTGIGVSRGQQAAAQQQYGGNTSPRHSGQGRRATQVGNRPELWKAYNAYQAPGASRGGRTT